MTIIPVGGPAVVHIDNYKLASGQCSWSTIILCCRCTLVAFWLMFTSSTWESTTQITLDRTCIQSRRLLTCVALSAIEKESMIAGRFAHTFVDVQEESEGLSSQPIPCRGIPPSACMCMHVYVYVHTLVLSHASMLPTCVVFCLG